MNPNQVWLPLFPCPHAGSQNSLPSRWTDQRVKSGQAQGPRESRPARTSGSWPSESLCQRDMAIIYSGLSFSVS